MAVRVTDGMIAVGGSVKSMGANMVCIYHKSGSLMKRVVTPCDKVISINYCKSLIECWLIFNLFVI